MKHNKHIRSNSCDVKIGRSNSREYDAEYRNRRLFHPRSHSRNNSRDLDFDSRHRRQPTHSRTNSRDDPMNIKYILNCLKPDASTNRLLLSSAAMLAQAAVAEHGAARAVRKHSRNHSYDQIYSMPNNIKIDQELHNRFHKNRLATTTAAATTSAIQPSATENDSNVMKTSTSNMNKEYLDNRNLGKPTELPSSTVITIGSHSRNNSKDLNKSSFQSSLVDDAANNILRHRRTNSKDLNRMLHTMPSTSSAIGGSGGIGSCVAGTSGCGQIVDSPQQQSQQQIQFHKRNLSRSKNEPHDAAHSSDVTQVLLSSNEINDTTDDHKSENE